MGTFLRPFCRSRLYLFLLAAAAAVAALLAALVRANTPQNDPLQQQQQQQQQDGVEYLSSLGLQQSQQHLGRQLVDSGLHGYTVKKVPDPQQEPFEASKKEGKDKKAKDERRVKKKISSALRYRRVAAAATAAAAVAAAKPRQVKPSAARKRVSPAAQRPARPSAAAAARKPGAAGRKPAAAGRKPAAAAAAAAAGPKEKSLLLADVAAEAPEVPLLDLLNTIEGGPQDSMAAAVARDSLRTYVTLKPLITAAAQQQQQLQLQQLAKTTQMRSERLELLRETQRQRAAEAIRKQQLLVQQRESFREKQREKQEQAAELRKEVATQFEEQRTQRERQWIERWASLREESAERLYRHREQQNLMLQLQNQATEEALRIPIQQPWPLWPGLGSREAVSGSSERADVLLPLQATQQSDILTIEQQLLQEQWKEQQQQNQTVLHQDQLYALPSSTN